MNRQVIINLIKSSKAAIMVAVIAMALSSCKSNGDIIPVVPPANLNIINAATDSLNVYQNGARLNNISTISPGSQSGYISVASGTQTYQLKKSGMTTYLVSSLPLKLDSGTFYSLFLAGETSDKIFLVTDTLPAVSTTAAAVRFINASPASTNLDVYVGSLSFLNQPFKAVGNFKPVATGHTLITIYNHATTTQLFSDTTTLTAGGAYTLFTKGIPGGAGPNQFSVVLAIN